MLAKLNIASEVPGAHVRTLTNDDGGFLVPVPEIGDHRLSIRFDLRNGH